METLKTAELLMIVGRGTHVIHGVVQLFFFFVGDDERSNYGGPAGDALFAGSQNRQKWTKTLFRVTILCILFLRRLLTEGVCSIVVLWSKKREYF